jgi:hypothetical protein
MNLVETQAFFGRYRDAFDRLDGDAVADLWHAPGGIADSRGGVGRLTWWDDDAAMRANHRALCAVYRASGFDHCAFEIVQQRALGADHAWACLRWTLWRADGSLLQHFHTGYQLLRTAAGPRVLLATAFEEDLRAMAPAAAAVAPA